LCRDCGRSRGKLGEPAPELLRIDVDFDDFIPAGLTPKQGNSPLGDAKRLREDSNQLEICPVIESRRGDVESESGAVVVDDGRATSTGANAQAEAAAV
jgi:hypothetical protein